jgi:hypothetical protein
MNEWMNEFVLHRRLASRSLTIRSLLVQNPEHYSLYQRLSTENDVPTSSMVLVDQEECILHPRKKKYLHYFAFSKYQLQIWTITHEILGEVLEGASSLSSLYSSSSSRRNSRDCVAERPIRAFSPNVASDRVILMVACSVWFMPHYCTNDNPILQRVIRFHSSMQLAHLSQTHSFARPIPDFGVSVGGYWLRKQVLATKMPTLWSRSL